MPKKVNLSEIWFSIIEDYYSTSNKRGYNIVIRELKKRTAIKNRITTCYAALLLLKLNENNEKAIETLNLFGYKNKNFAQINSALLKEKSKLNLLEKKNKSENKKEKVNFWLLVAQVESARGHQIDVDKISLSRWVAIIKDIKIKSDNQRKNGRKRKNR